jgi:hypothetical protein
MPPRFLQFLVSEPSAGWGSAVLNPPAPPAARSGAASAAANAPPAGYPPGLHAIDARLLEKDTFLGRIMSLGPQISDFLKGGETGMERQVSGGEVGFRLSQRR